MEGTESQPVKYRSVSQYNQFKKCPYSYYLQRRIRAWQKPAAWLPQGTAVHKAAEEWEKSGREMSLDEAQAIYTRSYAEEVTRYCQDTPNWDYWFRSGPYKCPEDVDRRYDKGFEQVESYVRYYTETAPREVIWITPDGKPAIELEFDIDLDGVKVRGFIDQITMVQPVVPKPLTKSGKPSTSKKALAEYEELVANTPFVPTPRDIKTGNKPGDAFQLATYDVAVEEQYGIKADQADYWMGRLGKPTKLFDLTEWTRERVTEEFHWLDESIKAEEFEPLPETDKCNFCSVKNACEFSLG